MARNTRLEKNKVINQDKDIKSVNCFFFGFAGPAGACVYYLLDIVIDPLGRVFFDHKTTIG